MAVNVPKQLAFSEILQRLKVFLASRWLVGIYMPGHIQSFSTQTVDTRLLTCTGGLEWYRPDLHVIKRLGEQNRFLSQRGVNRKGRGTWHGQDSLNRTAQKHANDSHLTTAIIKGDSPMRYLLVKEKADLRSESHSDFQLQCDIYYSLP